MNQPCLTHSQNKEHYGSIRHYPTAFRRELANLNAIFGNILT